MVPSRSRSETVMTRDQPSIATWPKNWKPSAGDVFGTGGALEKTTSGPNGESSTNTTKEGE